MHLHIGLHPVNMNRFFRQLGGQGLSYTVDGDGWNVWGEGVSLNGNDEWTLHVIVPVKNAEQANEVLALGPLMTEHAEGFSALLTDDTDWTVVYQTFPDNVPGLVPNEVLTDLACLRDMSLSFANEYSGTQVSKAIAEADDAYERLFQKYTELYRLDRQS